MTFVKYSRCGKCRRWARKSHLVSLTCPACDYHVSRCKNCDGFVGAKRSIWAHFAYWRTRGNSDGGHYDRMKNWARDVINQLVH